MEVILRSISAHIFALAYFVDPGSLVKLPKTLHTGYVAVIFLCPAIVISTLLDGFCTVIRWNTTREDQEHSDAQADFCFNIPGDSLIEVYACPLKFSCSYRRLLSVIQRVTDSLGRQEDEGWSLWVFSRSLRQDTTTILSKRSIHEKIPNTIYYQTYKC